MNADGQGPRSARFQTNTRQKVALVLCGVLVALCASEVVVRLYLKATRTDALQPAIPLHVLCHCGYLFQPNPDRAEISRQGLRDREFVIPKPRGVFRILVLGDSVAFGNGVAPEQTFPKRLESMLQDRQRPVEVLNSGVAGYTPYNELHYYLERGREFAPDVVVLQACLNDAVNPRLHWDISQQTLPAVPLEAIPNLDYDRDVIQPTLAALWDPERLARSHPSILRRSRLYSFLEARFRTAAETERLVRLDRKKMAVKRDGVTWPVFVTGEDSISLLPLMDYDSPEWRWLRGVYDRWIQAVRADGAVPVLAVAPLAYQGDPAYPFLPQALFRRYCDERGIACVDPLPLMRQIPADRIFLFSLEGRQDIWHLAPQGHDVFAAEIERELQRRGLLPD